MIAAGSPAFQQKSARGLSAGEVTRGRRAGARALGADHHGELAAASASLATIATTSPFIGLFGTVVGIIHAFQDIADARQAAASTTVSQGIAEALVTTALGLVVADAGGLDVQLPDARRTRV